VFSYSLRVGMCSLTAGEGSLASHRDYFDV